MYDLQGPTGNSQWGIAIREYLSLYIYIYASLIIYVYTIWGIIYELYCPCYVSPLGLNSYRSLHGPGPGPGPPHPMCRSRGAVRPRGRGAVRPRGPAERA